VVDTTRIEDALKSLQLLQEHSIKTLIIAHLGRPDGVYNSEYSLHPIVPVLQELLHQKVGLIEYRKDISEVKALLGAQSESILLLENIRFWKGEEDNSEEFVEKLAQLGDAYINECFATSHRKHASMVGLPKTLPHYAGVSLAQEVATLNRVKHHPEHPFVVVIGGAKLETKEPLVNAFVTTADKILVGGKVAFELASHPEPLPANVVLAETEPHGKDITQASAEQFAAIINEAALVVWNGAMGVFEEDQYALGTKIVGKAMTETKGFTVVGGGDTETALTQFDLESGIDFISTGGGAMLEYLTQSNLPALEALG
jgi:phosphoglycerate kinase